MLDELDLPARNEDRGLALVFFAKSSAENGSAVPLFEKFQNSSCIAEVEVTDGVEPGEVVPEAHTLIYSPLTRG